MDPARGDFRRLKGHLWSHPSIFQQSIRFRQVSFEELRSTKDEVLLSGSDDDLSADQHVAKKRRIEKLADKFLDGIPLFVSCARPCPASLKAASLRHSINPNRPIFVTSKVPSSSEPSSIGAGGLDGQLANQAAGPEFGHDKSAARPKPEKKTTADAIHNVACGKNSAKYSSKPTISARLSKPSVTADTEVKILKPLGSAPSGRIKVCKRGRTKDTRTDRKNASVRLSAKPPPQNTVKSVSEIDQIKYGESPEEQSPPDQQIPENHCAIHNLESGSSRMCKLCPQSAEGAHVESADAEGSAGQSNSIRKGSYRTAPEDGTDPSTSFVETGAVPVAETEETSQEQILRQQCIRAKPRKSWATVNQAQETKKDNESTNSAEGNTNPSSGVPKDVKKANQGFKPIYDKFAATQSKTTPFRFRVVDDRRVNEVGSSVDGGHKRQKRKPKVKDSGNSRSEISTPIALDNAKFPSASSRKEEGDQTKPLTPISGMPLVDQHLNQKLPLVSPSAQKSKTLRRALRKQLRESGGVIIRAPGEHLPSSQSESSYPTPVAPEKPIESEISDKTRRQSTRNSLLWPGTQAALESAQHEMFDTPNQPSSKAHRIAISNTKGERKRKSSLNMQRSRLSGESLPNTQQLINDFGGWSTVKKPGGAQSREVQISDAKREAGDTTISFIDSPSRHNESPRTPLRKQMARLSDVMAPTSFSGAIPSTGGKDQHVINGSKSGAASSPLRHLDTATSVDPGVDPVPVADAVVPSAETLPDDWGLSLGNDTSVTQIMDEVASDVLDISDMDMVLNHMQ